MGFEEVFVALANLAGIVVIVLARCSLCAFKEQIGMGGLGKPRSHIRRQTSQSASKGHFRYQQPFGFGISFILET